MLAAAEVGNRLGKQEFKELVPDLRVGLLNAQFDLRSRDFSVVVFVAGDDRLAASDAVNRLHEWMDGRYISTSVFGDQRPEEAERPPLWRLWQAMPPHGRIAILAGGLLRQIAARLAGDIDDAALDAWTRHLEAFQAELLADGALVIKLFLHTPAGEQRARMKAGERDAAAAGASTPATGRCSIRCPRRARSWSASCAAPRRPGLRGRSSRRPTSATAT